MSKTLNNKISVIVPIYKVEKYMDDCIISITNQSYKNLEIILVDDGSPDNCPAKCDAWAEKDNRIKVVHKKNGGLSSARNAGLEVATGDFIGFVDSDDYIAPEMYESLLFAILESKEKVCVANGRILRDKDGVKSPYAWYIDERRVIQSSDFALDTILQKVSFPVWSKLYDAEILKEVRFMEGRNNEDTLFMFELSKVLEIKGKGMVDVPVDCYYYRDREDSICTTSKKPIQIDYISNLMIIHSYYLSKMDKRSEIIKAEYNSILVTLITLTFTNNEWESKYFQEYYTEMCALSMKDMLHKHIPFRIVLLYVALKINLPLVKKYYQRKYQK